MPIACILLIQMSCWKHIKQTKMESLNLMLMSFSVAGIFGLRLKNKRHIK